MSEADRHRLPGVISREIQHCLQMFRPKDPRLGQIYDHVVCSDVLGMLVAPRMSEHEGVSADDWFEGWRRSADELVPDYVDVEYSDREFEEVRARISHALIAVDKEDDEREALLEDLEDELREG